MSDDDKSGDWPANEGVTLPDREDATYNVSLSPFFHIKSGYTLFEDREARITNRGAATYLWSDTPRSRGLVYYYVSNSSDVRPSSIYNLIWAASLRCLVSTNNRIMNKDKKESLVSDDTTPNQSWLINGGVTLPDGKNATYNMSLSPLFFNREGRSGASGEEITIAYRGEGGRSSSSTTKTPNSVYFLVFGHSDLYPSGNNSRTYGFTLRCLVSTNNKIMILHADQAQAYQFGERWWRQWSHAARREWCYI